MKYLYLLFPLFYQSLLKAEPTLLDKTLLTIDKTTITAKEAYMLLELWNLWAPEDLTAPLSTSWLSTSGFSLYQSLPKDVQILTFMTYCWNYYKLPQSHSKAQEVFSLFSEFKWSYLPKELQQEPPSSEEIIEKIEVVLNALDDINQNKEMVLSYWYWHKPLLPQNFEKETKKNQPPNPNNP